MNDHFIIAGGQRCGTTWLLKLLDRHPQIYVAKPFVPEPKFFLIDELYKKGVKHYAQKWFRDAPPGAVTVEKSTNYLENAHVAARIQKLVPHVKLIFVLRDPVERAFSNFLFSKMNGFETEDFCTAIASENSRKRGLPETLRYTQPFAYFSRGLYAQHLTPFFEKFARNSILFLKFEDIISAPALVAERVHSFFGLTVRIEDTFGLGVINKANGRDTHGFPSCVRDRLRDAYADPNRELTELLGPKFQWESGAQHEKH